MLYNYEIKYSDGTVVKNKYSMTEEKAFEMLSKEITEHFENGDGTVSIISAKIVAVR